MAAVIANTEQNKSQTSLEKKIRKLEDNFQKSYKNVVGFLKIKKRYNQPCVMTPIFNLSIWEAEAGKSLC